jgi:HD-like signal output (HDOD) protein
MLNLKIKNDGYIEATENNLVVTRILINKAVLIKWKYYVHIRRIKRDKKLLRGAGTQKRRSLSSNKITHKLINDHKIDNNSFQLTFVTLFGCILSPRYQILTFQ